MNGRWAVFLLCSVVALATENEISIQLSVTEESVVENNDGREESNWRYTYDYKSAPPLQPQLDKSNKRRKNIEVFLVDFLDPCVEEWTDEDLHTEKE